MDKNTEKIIRSKKIDIRDIYYFVDRVKSIKLKKSLLESLGYKIGYNVATKGCKEKDIIVGKNNEIRVQIEKYNDFPLVTCAIIY